MKLRYRVQRHELQSDTELRIFLTGVGHQSDLNIIRPLAEALQYPVGTLVEFSVDKE